MLLSLFLAFTVAQTSPESIFADSQWLQDPRLHSDVESLLDERLSPDAANAPSPDALLTLYRHEITLKAPPAEALLYVTGDSYFQLFLNGEQAVEGPAPAYPSSHPYFWLDVTPFLREGLNTLGARTYYADEGNARFHHGSQRGGFLLVLEVGYPDQTKERFVTNEHWRLLPVANHAVRSHPDAHYRITESMAQNAYPQDWHRNGFDDSAWLSPQAGFQDHHFVLQSIPPLQRSPIEAYAFRKLEQDVLLYDFGLHLHGRISLRPSGKAGETIRILTGNELKSDGSGISLGADSSNEWMDTIALDGSGSVVSLLLPRTFRYIELRGATATPELKVYRLHYPFDASAVRFASDDEHLERLWALSRNSLYYGIQDHYPGAAGHGYFGDAYLAARSHLWLSGDARLLRKTLHDFQEALAWQPHIPTAPFRDHTEGAPEHGLFIPMLLELYWQHGGDQGLILELLDSGLPELFRRYAAYENEYGLLAGLGGRSLLAELPESARDNYGTPKDEAASCAFQNVFYYGALTTAARLAESLDRSAAGYRAKARRIEAAFASQLADKKSGLYRDSPKSRQPSLPVNALALYFGLAAGVDPEAQARHILKEGMPGHIATAIFALDALFERGYGEEAYALLQSNTPRSWHRMIDAGASSTLSHWPGIHVPHRSWLAPETAAPIWLIVERVMGIRPTQDGVRIAPTTIPGLPAFEFALPTRLGSLTARFHPEEGYTIWAPGPLEVETMEEDGINITVHQQTQSISQQPSEGTLSAEDRAHLLASGWMEHVGEDMGVWIDVDRQHFYILKNMEVVWDTVCATASNGTGSEVGSYKKPLGWHIIGQRFGENAAWGQVFRARQATQEIWQPGMDTKEDLVLTRVLWLEGLEPGKNMGTLPDGTLIDSKRRYIYIHGTNGENVLGRPSSHGCVRLGNDAVIEAFDMLPSGIKVFISERTGESADRAVPLS